MIVIDVDDPGSWPDDLREAVSELAEAQGSPEHLDEIDLPDDGDDFQELIRGRLVRAFHATRLLEHEIANIRFGGLAPLSQALIERRIQGAVIAGDLEQLAGESLLHGNALKSRRNELRADQVCLFLSDCVMRDEVGGIWKLLTIWGGEGINFTHAGNAHKEVLRIGQPAIVVAHLDLSGNTISYNCWPELRRIFVGRWLGFGVNKEGRFGASLYYYGAIPGNRVEDVLIPGHPAYDRYPDLPRE